MGMAEVPLSPLAENKIVAGSFALKKVSLCFGALSAVLCVHVH